MYEWLVAQVGSSAALAIVLGILVILLLAVIGGVIALLWRPVSSSSAASNPSQDVSKIAPVAEKIEADKPQNPVQDERQELTQDTRNRLALCDSVIIDEHRRLVLVRRDDVEHLILVGGAGDMVIERNIPVEPQALDSISMLAIARRGDAGFITSPPSFMAIEEDVVLRNDEKVLAQLSSDQIKGNEAHAKQEEMDHDNLGVERKREEVEDAALPAQQFHGLPDVISADLLTMADFDDPQIFSQQTSQQVGEDSDNVLARKNEENLASELAMDSILSEPVVVPDVLKTDSSLLHSAPKKMMETSKPENQSIAGDASPFMTMAAEAAAHRLQEPPVASYFAGQKKRLEPIEEYDLSQEEDYAAVSPLRTQEEDFPATNDPLPFTAFSAPLSDREGTGNSTNYSSPSATNQIHSEPSPALRRVLPLNPFIHAQPSLKQVQSLSSQEVDSSRTQQVDLAQSSIAPAFPDHTTIKEERQPNAFSTVDVDVMQDKPVSIPDVFVSSFLGYPLQQLTKTEAAGEGSTFPPKQVAPQIVEPSLATTTPPFSPIKLKLSS